MRAALFVLGALVVVATWSSVLRTLVVPRGLSSRLTAGVTKVVGSTYDLAAARFKTYVRKDAILSAQGPSILVALLTLWVLLFLAGFSLMLAGATGHPAYDAIRESGSSLFTLGSTATVRPLATGVTFFAAATGLVVVALQIAYLPTFYGAFNRRETLVTLLQSRAGAPAWGPELLARHQLVGILDALPRLYEEWERWAADVAESHTNYPVLVKFRSPHPMRSWIVGLLAVLDSAALHLALNPSYPQAAPRLCLRMGFTSLRDICAAIGVAYDPDPLPTAPIALTYDDYLLGIARLERAGYPMERSAEEAWPDFRGWRVNYEQQCYALAVIAEAVPAMWSGPRRHSGEYLPPARPPDRTPANPQGR